MKKKIIPIITMLVLGTSLLTPYSAYAATTSEKAPIVSKVQVDPNSGIPYYCTGDGVRVRSLPSTGSNSKILGLYYHGDIVWILEGGNSEYTAVNYNGVLGYVAWKYIGSPE